MADGNKVKGGGDHSKYRSYYFVSSELIIHLKLTLYNSLDK